MNTPTAVDSRRVVSNIFKGSMGNLVEWYDWYVYTAFALYFAPVFFPKGSPTSQLLNTAAVFAVGFLMRPVGSFLLGRYADRHGRRAALTLSVTLMATGSLVIACTPGHSSIGIAAPVLLVTARLLQGLSVGGEYGTSATYMSEVASQGRRGFFSSFQYVTLAAGQLVALAVQILLQQVLTKEELASWGWRIPFVVGAVAAVIVFWLRRTMDETPAFEAQPASRRFRQGSLAELAKHPRAVATVVGLTLGGTVAFYTFTTYLQKFMVNTTGLQKTTVTWINFLALLVFVLLQPLGGMLSDRVGRRPLLIFFAVGTTLLTVPLLTALETATPVAAFFLMLAGLVVVTGYTSINAIVKAELFPTSIRALGVGMPYGVTVAVFGGTAEYVALWLKNAGHESAFYYYVSACAAISLIVYLTMSETRGRHLGEKSGSSEQDRRPAPAQ